MEAIHDILKAIDSSSKLDVLATIIRVQGSAYRKEGSSMLIKEDGTTIGMLSANCLETDLSFRINEIRKRRISQTIEYDMRAEDDLSWGQGAGCNGIVHVLLEPVDCHLRNLLYTLKFYLEEGIRVTMVKTLTPENSVSQSFFVTDNRIFLGKKEKGISAEMKRYLKKLHQSHLKSGVRYSSELSTNLYIHSFQPKPRLIIFGAGPDARPLVKFASQTGFAVTISDWRPHLCNQENFPEAERIMVGTASNVIPKLNLSSYDSVLLLTHQFQRDQEFLQMLIGQKLMYVGVLGSKERTRRLLDGRQQIPAEITSPAGLSIGAEGPEEIAISILAELINTYKKTPIELAVNL